MEKMTKKEIIEWLDDLAERARTAYIKSGDDLARKDNDCIMAAIDIIGRADEQSCEAEQGETCRTPASAFDGMAMKAVFEEAYRPTTGMSFGLAIEAAKKGHRISRAGWNGKGQYVEIAAGISYVGPDGEIVNAEHDAIGNRALAFVGTSGVQMGWLASQADMLADDWTIVS